MDDKEYFILSMERASKGVSECWWVESEWGYVERRLAGRFARGRAFDICRLSGYEDLPVPVEALEGQ